MRPDLAAYVLAGVCVVTAGACKVAHVEPPDFVGSIALVSVGGGAGVSYARGRPVQQVDVAGDATVTGPEDT